jgi:uncharacterized RDD family membrane protein YckC
MLPFRPEDTHVTVRRALAQIVDYVVLAPASFAVDALISSTALSWLVTGAIVLIYFGRFQGMTGWTVGKYVTGIRVVDERGNPPGAEAGIKRTLPLLIEWLGVIALIFILRSAYRQRAGDRWAGTYVVRTTALRDGRAD